VGAFASSLIIEIDTFVTQQDANVTVSEQVSRAIPPVVSVHNRGAQLGQQ
jgi:hypothetical protein